MASVFPKARVVARLKGIAALKVVGIAKDLADALETTPRDAPAVFVLARTRATSAIKFSGTPVQQSRETTVSLVIWVRSHSTDAEKTSAAVDEIVEAIDKRLAGWSPIDDRFGALVFASSQDEFTKGQYAVVQSTHTCAWNFSAPVQQ